MFPALASRRPAATASAAPRSRSGRSGVLWSCWITARSVVMDDSVRPVIMLYYHELNLPRIGRVLAWTGSLSQAIPLLLGKMARGVWMRA